MNKTIYYFTATGNSLRAALDIAEGLGGAEVVSVTKAGMNAVCDSEVIGFVFPVFAWGMPSMVNSFIESLNLNKDAYLFAVATCGMFAGGTLKDLEDLLRAKGAKLSYGKKLRMVANYIPMYDAKTETRMKILAKAERALASIISDIKERKSCQIKGGVPRFGEKTRRNTWAEYKVIDKDYNVNESCVGCGTCAAVCPARNIVIEEGNPAFQHNCEHCLACIHWCPQEAINFKDKTQNKRRYHHPKVKAEQLP